MNNKFEMRKAERKQAKIRIGMFGPSGSGKTMSSLKLARGLTEWDKVVIIDTENHSADLYSHMGDYNVLSLTAPFTPEKYVEAIEYCNNERMEVIIIDSITHEWSGKGGILEISDELGKSIKNGMQVWAKLTPRHNKFITAILESSCHVICCGRSKQDYVMNQQEKGGRIVNVPEKVGLKAITREGFDYEMTLSFDLAINHYANTSKDRTNLFMDRPDFVIGEDTGKTINEWNASGAVNVGQQKLEIMRQANRIGIQTAEAELLKADIYQFTKLELVEENFENIINKLRKTKTIAEQIKEDTKTPPKQPQEPPFETKTQKPKRVEISEEKKQEEPEKDKRDIAMKRLKDLTDPEIAKAYNRICQTIEWNKANADKAKEIRQDEVEFLNDLDDGTFKGKEHKDYEIVLKDNQ